MSGKMKSELEDLKKDIFNMLNCTNIYTLVLDEEMNIQFANNKLSKDLGFNSYQEIVGKCWLDFITEEEKELIANIHYWISKGKPGWEKYQEHRNYIIANNKESMLVHWFNSHINSSYNWSFSFGINQEIKEEVVSMSSIRHYYKTLIEKDRNMINSMRDVMNSKTKLNTCGL